MFLQFQLLPNCTSRFKPINSLFVTLLEFSFASSISPKDMSSSSSCSGSSECDHLIFVALGCFLFDLHGFYSISHTGRMLQPHQLSRASGISTCAMDSQFMRLHCVVINIVISLCFKSEYLNRFQFSCL